MKKIQLTQGKFALVDDSDFDFLNQWKWQFGAKGYATRLEGKRVNGSRKRVFMHKLILSEAGTKTDHRNRNSLDNRRENLRIATHSENRRNAVARKGSSKYKGVTATKGKYLARIYGNGIRYNLGHFESEKTAALIYNMHAKALFGEFALLNKI